MTTLTSNDGFVEHYDATKLRKSFVRSTSCINRIHHAREELLSGKPVLLVDDDGDEAAGHLVICAEQARVGAVSFLVRHSSGYLCVAMESERCRKLGLPPAWESDAPDRSRFDYRIAVDAATGIGTGISATDRARTAHVLADEATVPGDLTRPGHVIPVAAAPTGVLTADASVPEFVVELVRATGKNPVAMYGAMVGEGITSLPSRRELLDFAAQHSLVVLTHNDIRMAVAHRDGRSPEAAVLVEANDTVRIYQIDGIGLSTPCHVVAPAQLRRESEVVVEVRQVEGVAGLLTGLSTAFATASSTETVTVYVPSTSRLTQILAPTLVTRALDAVGCTASARRDNLSSHRAHLPAREPVAATN